MNQESALVMDQWMSRLAIPAQADPWSVVITLSTVPMDRWFYQRNALRPEDIQLRLIAPGCGLWYAELNRHDELFWAQWRPHGDFRVESQQLKYRRLVQWPRLDSLLDFPYLAGRIEQALSIRFIRHANVSASGFLDLDAWLDASSQKIRDWLSPSADTLGKYLQSAKISGGRP